MKTLIICSGNAGYISPFVKEQAEVIASLDNKVVIYPIVGKGISGCLSNLSSIKKFMKFKPNIIYAL
jgi:hypothetical protein